MLPEHSRAVIEKYRFNQQAGESQYKDGNITPFTGYGPTHENGIALRAFYTPDSTRVINCQIAEINTAAATSGILLYRAGELWEIHSTISNLIYNPNTTPGSKNDCHDRVLDHPLSNRAKEAIDSCEELRFNYLFWGNAITIACTNIPEAVIEARKHMSQIAKELDMDEQDNNNILHVTVARIEGLGHNPRLLDFSKDLWGIHHRIQDKAMSATVSDSSLIPNGDFLNTGEAELFKCLRSIRK